MQGAPLSASQLSTFAEGQSQDEVANSLDPSQWLDTQDGGAHRTLGDGDQGSETTRS